MRAYDRLYRSLDFDEPDVSANISYSVCRHLLERRAAAEPYDVPAERADRIRQLVATVDATADPRTLAFWFPGFAERVLGELERRAGRTAEPVAGGQRRAGDRAATPAG